MRHVLPLVVLAKSGLIELYGKGETAEKLKRKILAEKLDYMHTRRLWHSIFLYVIYPARERSYICINVYPSSSRCLSLSNCFFLLLSHFRTAPPFLFYVRYISLAQLISRHHPPPRPTLYNSLFLYFPPPLPAPSPPTPRLFLFVSNSYSSLAHPDVRWTYTRLLSGSLYTLLRLFALRYFK